MTIGIRTDVRRKVSARGLADPASIFNEDDAIPGDCAVASDGRLLFSCPGCAKLCGVMAGNPRPPKPSWEIIRGQLDRPETLTLYPAISCDACCGWNGYLKDGVFEPVWEETPPGLRK